MGRKCNSNLRSISMPTRSHPTTLRIEEELNKLKAYMDFSSRNLESISSSGLLGLESLYTSMDDLLNMASTQQALSRHGQDTKTVDELLDGSMKLLDITSGIRDMVSEFQEQVKGLHSSLRRRKGLDSVVANFTGLRKEMRKDAKMVVNSMRQLMDEKFLSASSSSSLLSDNDHGHFCAVVKAIREVFSINVLIFQSLLEVLTMPEKKVVRRRWRLVGKWMHKGMIECEQEKSSSELSIEGVSELLLESRGQNVEKMKMGCKRLEGLEMTIDELENGLEVVFRRLIKTRASLLNIISH